jgi:hypothetical protein
MKPRTARSLVASLVAAVAAVAIPAGQAGAAEEPPPPVPVVVPFASPSGDLTDEPSGLAASRRDPGTYLWQNEAPRNGGGMVYAVNPAGGVRSFWFSPAGPDRPSARMLDFEDMSAGPCEGPGLGSCLWVGDIGRVSADFPAANKDVFWLYRMPEPDVDASPNGTRLAVTGRYPFTLPQEITDEGRLSGGSTASYDMEALMVHPQSGALYVVTKGANTAGLVRILHYPMPLEAGVVKELEVVRTVQMPHSSSWNPATLAGQGNHLVTGADIHPDGTRFLLRTYGRIWEFGGRTFEEALADPSPTRLTRAPGALDHQGEAVAYTAAGTGYATLGEYSATTTRNLWVAPL